MKEHTDDYKEAKVIIQNSVNDDYTKHTTKVAGLRALFASVVGLGAVVGAGLASGVPLAVGMIPVGGLISFPFMALWLTQKSANKKVQTGEYFKGKSQEDVLRIANAYVDKNNEYEAGRS